MADRDASYQLANLVEMDDSYFGPSGRGQRGRGTKGKVPVVVAVENRGKKPGFAAMRVVDNLKSVHIAHFAKTKIKEQQTVKTCNWIDAYYAKNGVYPSLPEYLAIQVNGYTPGKPVSKNLEIPPPSAQWLNRLDPSQITKWRQLVEWLGKNPDDLIAQSKRMLPTSEPKQNRRWLPTHRPGW